MEFLLYLRKHRASRSTEMIDWWALLRLVERKTENYQAQSCVITTVGEGWGGW